MTRRFASIFVVLLLAALTLTATVNGIASGGAPGVARTYTYNGRSFDGTVLQKGHGSNNQVALIHVSGAITSGTSAANGSSVGGEDLVGQIRSIRKSGDFDAILLELDTPGGGVLPSAEVAHEVDLARRDGLKVVSWMRDVAASGGYYISAGTDSIVAAPQTITGSIGVIFEYLQVAGLADKVGVAPVVVKSGKLKDMGSPYREMTAEERVLLQQLITESYNGFVQVVSKGRHMPETQVRKLADGRIYTGEQAISNGLVDHLGFRDTAYAVTARLLRKQHGSDLRVVEYGPRVSFFDALGASTGSLAHPSSATDIASAVMKQLIGQSTGGGASADVSTDIGSGASASNGSPISLQYRAVL